MLVNNQRNFQNKNTASSQIKDFRKNKLSTKVKPQAQLNVLFLAPHPFYQDRGTPINTSLVLKILSEQKHHVDVVTFPEGKDIYYENVKIHRTLKIPFLTNIRPGFSCKKLVYDFLMLIKVIQLASAQKYDLVQAVEESVFIALLLKVIFKTPYVYDMDSSIAQQMVEQISWLAPVDFILNGFEKIAIKNAKAVVPVCHAIADDIAKYRPEKVAVLPDISLLGDQVGEVHEDIRQELGIKNKMLMYVGNLETYQGIDLLLESFAVALDKTDKIDLVIIGGDAVGIAKYQAKAEQLGISQKVHFMGSRPAQNLRGYLSQADILVSPRIKGKNTPMKIYSYLDSGKAVLATDLLTHTQVLNDEISMLAQPTPTEFSQGIIALANNPNLCTKLGMAGKALIQEKHSYNAFRKIVKNLYDWLKLEILPPQLKAE